MNIRPAITIDDCQIAADICHFAMLYQLRNSRAMQTTPPTWTSFPCILDAGPAPTATIGLIALASDIVIEPELRTFLPQTGVGLYTNRIPMPKIVAVDTLRQMGDSITDVTAGLVPDDHLDVVIYGCTSGSMTIGPERVAAKIHAARPNVATTDPISAGLKGLRTLNCQRIALLTPYIDEVNQLVETYIRGQGFDLAAMGSFNQVGDPEISRVPPQAIYDAALTLGKRNDIDGIFLSCTALRTSGIIQPLEDALSKPVVASNQALTWDALRLSGYSESVHGFGRLLTL